MYDDRTNMAAELTDVSCGRMCVFVGGGGTAGWNDTARETN